MRRLWHAFLHWLTRTPAVDMRLVRRALQHENDQRRYSDDWRDRERGR